MARLREAIAGPWRAVAVLGATQIIGWGTLFYPPVLTLPLVAADRGWTLTFAMGGFSLGLLVAGLASPAIGVLIDRHGGHRVMPFGSLLGALGLTLIVLAEHPAMYLAAWAVVGVAIGASLYDPAFATLARIFGAAARRPITVLTLAGGFASTVSWPATYALLEAVGWKATYLVYAAVLALVAAPLHAFALPSRVVEMTVTTASVPQRAGPLLPPRGIAFAVVAAAFATYAFVPSALSAHLLAIFTRAGLEAGTVVMIGALFGPAQVAARICELTFARRWHPVTLARGAITALLAGFAVLALAGVTWLTAAVFALLFGIANGLITIARGTVPLTLFGPLGYGAVVGRIAGPSLVLQAAAPLIVAFIAERASDAAALALTALMAVTALACLMLLRRPAG